MLKHRFISGSLIGLVFLIVVNFVPVRVMGLLAVALAILLQLEFYAMVNKSGIPVFRMIGIAGGASLICSTFLTIGPETVDIAKAYKWEQLVVLGSIVAVLVRQFPQKHNDKPLETIACTLLGLWYAPYLMNFFVRLMLVWDGTVAENGFYGTGRMLVLYVVVVVKCSDMGAYFAGRRFGRHRLFPRVSPGKTWEGFVGGLVTALVVSAGFSVFAEARLGSLEFGMGHAVILGIVLGIVGMVGDLFESLIKRASGAKDSSSIIPGMGGALDVMDSLLFGVPAFYVYARLFLK